MSEESANRPRHIAVIMDGNGRWARGRGSPRAHGHQAGFRTTRDIVEACGKLQIESLTMFAFSSENWKRPETEVGFLLDLFLRALQSEVEKLHENRVCIQFIGDRTAFSDKLQLQMSKAEEKTAKNDGLKLAIAVNYGGRWDIVNAAKKIAEHVKQGDLNVDDINQDLFGEYISLSSISEPDLFIRTGGEKRISNYLLWHLAYTELYFTDVLWPDFNEDELKRAIDYYAGRQRRFGQTGDQVVKSNA